MLKGIFYLKSFELGVLVCTFAIHMRIFDILDRIDFDSVI
jgi:hypothetical protein